MLIIIKLIIVVREWKTDEQSTALMLYVKEVHPMADFEFEITEADFMVDLDEYIDYLIIERCNEIYYKIVSRNVEYQNLQTELKSCYEELLKQDSLTFLEPALLEIVNERLPIAIGTLEMLLPRLIYRQVLKDGLRVKEWMGGK
jgi:hypothetical protein